MPTSWGDSVPNSEAENVVDSKGSSARPAKAAYVPPHLRNRATRSSETTTLAAPVESTSASRPSSGSRSAYPPSRSTWGNWDSGRLGSGYGGGQSYGGYRGGVGGGRGRSGGGWSNSNRSGGEEPGLCCRKHPTKAW